MWLDMAEELEPAAPIHIYIYVFITGYYSYYGY